MSDRSYNQHFEQSSSRMRQSSTPSDSLHLSMTSEEQLQWGQFSETEAPPPRTSAPPSLSMPQLSHNSAIPDYENPEGRTPSSIAHSTQSATALYPLLDVYLHSGTRPAHIEPQPPDPSLHFHHPFRISNPQPAYPSPANHQMFAMNRQDNDPLSSSREAHHSHYYNERYMAQRMRSPVATIGAESGPSRMPMQYTGTAFNATVHPAFSSPSTSTSIATASYPRAAASHPLPFPVVARINTGTITAAAVSIQSDPTTTSRQTHCDLCGKGPFGRPNELRRHRATVHEPPKWVCDICQIRFKRKDDMERHKRTLHRLTSSWHSEG